MSKERVSNICRACEDGNITKRKNFEEIKISRRERISGCLERLFPIIGTLGLAAAVAYLLSELVKTFGR